MMSKLMPLDDCLICKHFCVAGIRKRTTHYQDGGKPAWLCDLDPDDLRFIGWNEMEPGMEPDPIKPPEFCGLQSTADPNI